MAVSSAAYTFQQKLHCLQIRNSVLGILKSIYQKNQPKMSDSNSKSTNMDDLIEKCQKIREQAEKAMRASDLLPSSDFVLYQSYSGFSKVMDHESTTIMQLLQALVKDEKVQNKSLAKASTEEQYDMIVEINDSILDRVGNLLDEAEGLKKKTEDIVIATMNVPAKRKIRPDQFVKGNDKLNRQTIKTEIVKHVIKKPQLLFEDKIDNFKIFEPIIKFKHNSIRPLSIVCEYNADGESFYPNPYETEIESYKLLNKYLKKVEHPQKPKPFEQIPFKFISEKIELEKLLEYLRTVEEFAVDLEYHNQRSFLGFTCLIQISTRDKDFIIDTIELRSYVHILNEVFTDPKILKILHGADLDIKWLQKDFGIYVVNMFDTGKASKLLQFASFSLSFLVKHYCNVALVKKYQLADWRIRPLSAGMLNYARSDTHSLLYIFDRMRNDLIKKGGVQLLKQAFEDSRKVCSNRFEVPLINENSYLALMKKNRIEFNNRQRQALKDIYYWRDKLARLEDECTNYILPNHMMLKMAEVLPQEQQGILACCNPIPVMVQKHLNALHLIILNARELPLKKSNDNVYQLKPIVNQIVDITSKMDIADEEHADEHVVKHDCLLDTPEMHHKIKLTKLSKVSEEGAIIGTFLAIKFEKSIPQSSNLTPYEQYCKVIQNKRKENVENLKNNEKIEIDINEVPEIVSKDITNEPRILETKIETEEERLDRREEELTEKLETHALIDIKKRKKPKPDIPCEVNKSIDNLITAAMTSGETDVSNNEDKQSSSQQFNYNQADYSIFSQTNQANKFFDPSSNFMKQKQKNKAFNSRTKRKRDCYISTNVQSNRKSK